jgi:hypothetical protein
VIFLFPGLPDFCVTEYEIWFLTMDMPAGYLTCQENVECV